MADTLYKRLGGYDAIAAVADDLLVRLQADPRLARFWQHRSVVERERSSLVPPMSHRALLPHGPPD